MMRRKKRNHLVEGEKKGEGHSYWRGGKIHSATTGEGSIQEGGALGFKKENKLNVAIWRKGPVNSIPGKFKNQKKKTKKRKARSPSGDDVNEGVDSAGYKGSTFNLREGDDFLLK